MTPGWPENFIKITENGPPCQNYSITVRLFSKSSIKRARSPALFTAIGFFKTLERENLTCFKKISYSSLIQTPDTRVMTFMQKPDPPGNENVRIPEGRPGGWWGLELTDT